MEQAGLGRIALSGLTGTIIALLINLIITGAGGIRKAFTENHNAPELIVLISALFYAFLAAHYFIRVAEGSSRVPLLDYVQGACSQNMAIGGIFYAVFLTTTYLLTNEGMMESGIIYMSFIIFYLTLTIFTVHHLGYAKRRALERAEISQVDPMTYRMIRFRARTLLFKMAVPYVTALILWFSIAYTH